MLDKFEVLMSWKLTWGLSFLFFGVNDGHIFQIIAHLSVINLQSVQAQRSNSIDFSFNFFRVLCFNNSKSKGLC